MPLNEKFMTIIKHFLNIHNWQISILGKKSCLLASSCPTRDLEERTTV